MIRRLSCERKRPGPFPSRLAPSQGGSPNAIGGNPGAPGSGSNTASSTRQPTADGGLELALAIRALRWSISSLARVMAEPRSCAR